ncbi:MAG: OB-fold protein, partial [Gemmataceae bacterium]
YAQAMSDFDKALALNPDDKTAYEAKQQTLDQWEGTAKQSRSKSGSAATVAPAAAVSDASAAEPTRTSAVPSKPTPAKTSPAKTKPSRSRPRRWRDDGEPARWLRPAKWVGSLVVVALLGYWFVPMVWAFVKVHSIPQDDHDTRVAEAKATAAELWERYQTNASSAQSQFGQKVIEVRGTVQDIKKVRAGKKDAIQIVLFGSSSGGRIVCSMPPPKSINQGTRLSSMERFGTVKLIGKCTGQADKTKTVNLEEVRLLEVRSR